MPAAARRSLGISQPGTSWPVRWEVPWRRRLRGGRVRHLEATVAIIRVLVGIGFVVLALQTTIPGFAVVYVVLFSFNGLMSAPDDTLFNDAVPRQTGPTLLSCRSLFMQGGGAISNVVMALSPSDSPSRSFL